MIQDVVMGEKVTFVIGNELNLINLRDYPIIRTIVILVKRFRIISEPSQLHAVDTLVVIQQAATNKVVMEHNVVELNIVVVTFMVDVVNMVISKVVMDDVNDVYEESGYLSIITLHIYSSVVMVMQIID